MLDARVRRALLFTAAALAVFLNRGTSFALEPARPGGEAAAGRLVEEGTKHLKAGDFLKAADAFSAATEASPGDYKSHFMLGSVLLTIWRFEEASKSLTRAHEIAPSDPAPLAWLARCDIHFLEYMRAFEKITQALSLDGNNQDARAMLCLLLIHLDDLDRAEEAAKQVLGANAAHGFAKVCLAHVKMLRKDPGGSAVLFAECLKENRMNSAAYVGLGQALSNMDRPADALRVLNAGAKKNPHLPSLFATRGFVLFKMKATEQACRDYRKALKMDPMYTGGHAIASFKAGTPEENRLPEGVEARAALVEALDAMESGSHSGGFELAGRCLELEPDNLFATLVRGAAAWSLEDFETALACSLRAMENAPEAPLPHVLFVSAYSQKQECRKLELSTVDYYRMFKALEAPEIPGIEKFFVNYESLAPDHKKVVRLAAAPFSRFLDKMAQDGVSHHILPLYRHLTDVEGMTYWRNKPTFDGRNYDGVRGAAGQIAVSGVETLWPSTRMGMNVIAHEFAHQVHRHALNGGQQSEIERLYKSAKKKGCCLDFYAAENEYEYFAQGYEAYVSPFKRPTSSETSKNTREDLRLKDPELFDFIAGLERGD